MILEENNSTMIDLRENSEIYLLDVNYLEIIAVFVAKTLVKEIHMFADDETFLTKEKNGSVSIYKIPKFLNDYENFKFPTESKKLYSILSISAEGLLNEGEDFHIALAERSNFFALVLKTGKMDYSVQIYYLEEVHKV